MKNGQIWLFWWKITTFLTFIREEVFLPIWSSVTKSINFMPYLFTKFAINPFTIPKLPCNCYQNFTFAYKILQSYKNIESKSHKLNFTQNLFGGLGSNIGNFWITMKSTTDHYCQRKSWELRQCSLLYKLSSVLI